MNARHDRVGCVRSAAQAALEALQVWQTKAAAEKKGRLGMASMVQCVLILPFPHLVLGFLLVPLQS